MDAPLPEDLGVVKWWFWDYHWWYRKGFLVPADTPDFFEEDGIWYGTEPYVRNDIDTGIN